MNSIVEAVAHYAAVKPDTVAVIAEGQQITYRELWREVRGFAAYIQSHGLEKGSRVIVKAKHSIWYVVACFGVHLAGCVFAPVDGKIGVERLKDIAEQLSVSMIVSDMKIEDSGYIQVDSSAVRDLATENFHEKTKFDFPQLEDLCDILFTTGTTGRSKGVMLSHRAVVAVVENFRSGYNLPKNNIYLMATPLNHSADLRGMYACMLTGTVAVLLDGFLNLKLFFQYIRDYHITTIFIPPYAVHMILQLTAKELTKYTDQLECIMTGGTTFPETDQEYLRKLLPHTRLYFGYGASEAGVISVLEYSRDKMGIGCVGKPTIHSSVFIVNDDKKEIQSSKYNLGRIAVSGPLLMSGYYNELELTKEVLFNEVLYTNDIGYIDEEGYLYILGRRGDVIDIDGVKIAPTEVEDIVLRFPGIAECVCFAVRDEKDITRLKLNIVEQQNSEIQITELSEYLCGNLEMFKVPRLIEKVHEIPKMWNGKIDRNALK